jgi:hypothetical protein
MREEIRLSVRSVLATAASEVWSVVGTMAGVNAELGPWFRMTTPDGASSLHLEHARTGVPLFSSWLLLRGIPVDRHALALEEVFPGAGFREHSTSWLEASWVHERRVRPAGEGACTVEDHLAFVPRVAILRPLVRRIVAATFHHRHRQLRRRFGTAPSSTPLRAG